MIPKFCPQCAESVSEYETRYGQHPHEIYYQCSDCELVFSVTTEEDF